MFRFFSWQLLLRVHRHEKELQNTQKINVSTEIGLHDRLETCSTLQSSGSGQREQTRDHLPPARGSRLPLLKCAKLIPDRHSLLLDAPTKQQAAANHIHHGIQRKRELISSVCDGTRHRKISIYIQDRAERKKFPVSRQKDHEWQYFTSSTSWGGRGKLLSLASCKAEYSRGTEHSRR